jgi:hypothetical protein
MKSKVFISYAHEDIEYLERFLVFLKPMQRKHAVDVWVDTRIEPGEPWKKKIEEALESAKIAVLLVSADFVASDFITDVELPRLLARAQEKGTTIMPVIVKPAQFSDTELSDYKAVNDPTNPLVDMSEGDRDRVWLDLAQHIEEVIARPLPGDGDGNNAISRQKIRHPDNTGPGIESLDKGKYGQKHTGVAVKTLRQQKMTRFKIGIAFAVLIALSLTLLIQIYYLYERIEHFSELGMVYIGDYKTGKLMHEIVKHLQSVAAKGQSSADTFIVADFANYGSLTFSERYQEYHEAILNLAKKAPVGGRIFKALFSSDTGAEKILKRQIPEKDWPDKIQDPHFRQKLEKWFALEDVQEAIRSEGALSLSALDNFIRGNFRELDYKTFVRCVMIHNAYVIKQLTERGALVKRSDKNFSFHFWLTGREMGVMGVVDVNEVIDEPGFRVQGEMGIRFWNTAHLYFEFMPTHTN